MNNQQSENNKKNGRKSLVFWLRTIHRDLGFFVVGFCIVYGISGIFLNHMDGSDPAYSTEHVSLVLSKNLSTDEVQSQLPDVKRVITLNDKHHQLVLSGGGGYYDMASGKVEYDRYSRREFVYWINKLHYNKLTNWHWAGDFFALSLLFLAISGMFMVKGKYGLVGRGKWLLLAGLIIPILYVIFS